MNFRSSLLPTAPAQIDLQAKPLFAGYRNVPWLARTHAVTVIPSASALVTLRHLPPGSPKRDKLIGFGDPYFNEAEAAEAEAPEAADTTQVVAVAAEPGRRRGDARPSAQAARLSSYRRCRHRGARDATEASGYPARIDRNGQSAGCRSRQGPLFWQGRQRAKCRDD